MLLIDDRSGSKELLPYFQPYDVGVELTRLEFADICWWGNGEDGLVAVGVELKNVNDLIASMRSNRLSGHQLPGLFENYGVVVLLVQGIWQAGENGEVQIWNGRGWSGAASGRGIMYREVDHYLATLEHKCGVVVKQTSTKQQTAAWVVSRYKWWNDKEWHQHRSHEAIYAEYEPNGGRGHKGRFMRRSVGLAEKVAAQLPGVDRAAWDVARRFGTVEQMVQASPQEWAGVEVSTHGKGGVKKAHLGMKRGEKIWRMLREE